MHDIEPHYKWLHQYSPAEDHRSPFYGKNFNRLEYRNTVYNYYIHPEWDDFGSETLYVKILYADYEQGVAIMELIGEWNDCLYNDIRTFKMHVIDPLQRHGIHKFILILENVLNFHPSDECYYEEWWEEVRERDGWIMLLNPLDHVREDFLSAALDRYLIIDAKLSHFPWRRYAPDHLSEYFDRWVQNLLPKKLI